MLIEVMDAGSIMVLPTLTIPDTAAISSKPLFMVLLLMSLVIYNICTCVLITCKLKINTY